MSTSNFSELRRIRTEMSAQAGHDVRRFIELMDEVRERYRDQLVNHGADAEHFHPLEPAVSQVPNGEPTLPDA